MKQTFLLVLLFIFSYNIFSKDYDLIVFLNGDSVACHIDSITDTHVYYMIKNRYQWVHTFIELSRISSYEFDAISKKNSYFKPGTSQLTEPDPNTPSGIALKAGIGFPEMINAGIRLQSAQFKVGLTIGGIPPIDGESFFSIAGDIYIHLGKKYLLKNKPPWCGRIGFSFLKNETDKFIEKYAHLTLRLGKDIRFSDKFGMEIYFGMMIQLMYDYTEKEDVWLLLTPSEFPVLPSGGIGFFYKF